jgi:hypothetical protein
MISAARTVLVYDPAGLAELALVKPNPFPAALGGITVGVLENSKPNARALMCGVAAELDRRFGGVKTVIRRKPTPALPATASDYEWLSRECDVVLTGSGD